MTSRHTDPDLELIAQNKLVQLIKQTTKTLQS